MNQGNLRMTRVCEELALLRTGVCSHPQPPPLCSPDGSLTEETSSVERDSQSDDESVLPSNTPTDQSEAFPHNDTHSNLEPRPEVSEAALQDG